jgi:hypothetical protein
MLSYMPESALKIGRTPQLQTSLRNNAALVIIAAATLSLVLFPVPRCFDCEFPNPYGQTPAVADRNSLIFVVWLLGGTFLTAAFGIKRAWLIPIGLTIADLATQHLGGVEWWDLKENEWPIILLTDLWAGFFSLTFGWLAYLAIEHLRERRSAKQA